MSKINIVQLQTALLIPITANFIKDKLKIEPVETEKRAMFWDAGQFVLICNALIDHIDKARATDIEKISGERTKKEPPPAAASEDFFNDSTPPAGDDFFGESSKEPEDFFQ